VLGAVVAAVLGVAGGHAGGAEQGKAVFKDVDAAAASKLLDQEKGIVVLDVRSSAEFGEGHIAKATNLDVNDAEFKAKAAKLDRSKPYLVHCAAGRRSARAVTVLKDLGFLNVFHLSAGLNDWKERGYPVEKPQPAK
jgi:rhodanese-related sulfurtransferase